MIDRRLHKIIEESLGRKYIFDSKKHLVIQHVLFIISHGNKSPKLNLPYKWYHYLRGPYSPEIESMINYISIDSFIKEFQLNNKDKKAINHFNIFKTKLEINEMIFELLASLVFISNELDGKGDFNQIFDTFEQLSSIKLSKDKIHRYYSILKYYKYI
jgi:uncharacterized protein YwgA